MSSNKIEYCVNKGKDRSKGCHVIPIDETNTSTAKKFSDYTNNHTFKTVKQGQPSNLTVTRIGSNEATISFTVRGKPEYYEIILEDSDAKYIYVAYTPEMKITNLLPNRTYHVNVIAYYITQQSFQINKTVLFRTSSKWKVSDVQILYPSNKTTFLTSSSKLDEIMIGLSFSHPPLIPAYYEFRFIEPDISLTLPTAYLKMDQYKFPIQNDISTNFEIISYYNDPRSSNNIFVYNDVIAPFQEGGSDFTLDIYANRVDVSFTRAPADPSYNIYLYDDKGKKLQTKHFTDPNPNANTNTYTESFDNLIHDTSYSINIETHYGPTTNNRYIYKTPTSFRTLDRHSIQNLRYIADINTLQFIWDFPPVTTQPFYYNADLSNSTIPHYDICNNISNTVHNVTFHNLSANEEYTFTLQIVYDTSNTDLYTVSNTYKTLNEGPIQYLDVSNITGNSVDVSYIPFGNSTPLYYILNYIHVNSGKRSHVLSYYTNHTIYNLLEPDTSYNITVDAVYASGNTRSSNTQQTIKTIKTLNESAVESISVLNTYGNRIDVSWNTYQTDVSYNIHVYDDDICLNSFLNISDISYSIEGLSHNSQFRVSVESVYKNGNKYEKSIFPRTNNEYAVEISRVISTGNTVQIFKEPYNNQDSYRFVRSSELQYTREWVSEPFGNIASGELSINPDQYYFAHMSQDGKNIFVSTNDGMTKTYTQRVESITGIQEFYYKPDADLDISNLYHSLDPTTSTNIGDRFTTYDVNQDGSRIVVGFLSNYVKIYHNPNNKMSFEKKILISGIRYSKYVKITPSGNKCAVADDYVYIPGNDPRNCVYVLDIDTGMVINEVTYPLQNLLTNFFTQYFETNFTFDESGNYLGVAWNLHTNDINGPISVRGDAFIYKYSSRQSRYAKIEDLSGTQLSFNPSMSHFAKANDYDISNGFQIGSVEIYKFNAGLTSNLGGPTHILYGSYNPKTIPYTRHVQINGTGTVVAIAEYTYNYINGTDKLGQVQVFDLSSNGVCLPRGNVLRIGDIDPIIKNDVSLTGEWFGFHMQLDLSGDVLMVATRPKLGRTSGKYEGNVFVYRYEAPLTSYEITEWPILVENLVNNTTYTFEIYSYYYNQPGYDYIRSITARTLDNEKPVPYFYIYYDHIDISWVPVPATDFEHYLFTIQTSQTTYTTHIDTVNTTHYDVSNLSPNEAVTIRFSSVYDISSIVTEYVGFDDTIYTLNEGPILENILVSLNTQNLVVLDFQNLNRDRIEKHEIVITEISGTSLSGNTYNATLDASNTLLDLSFVQPGNIYQCDVSSIYFQNHSTDAKYIFVTQPYFSSNTITVSHSTQYPNTYIQNGQFDGDYAASFQQNGNRTRNSVSEAKGIWETNPKQDFLYWKDSQYVYLAENVNTGNETKSFHKSLYGDISYHALLYRQEDLTPGIYGTPAFLCQMLANPLYPQYYHLSFYLANHLLPSDPYISIPPITCSELVSYKIELYTETSIPIYSTSTIQNVDISWSQINLKFYQEKSLRDVILKISRKNHEYNTLFVSDISLNRFSEPFEYNALWPHTGGDQSRWILLNSALQGIWKDTWVLESTPVIHRNILLSGNVTISFWIYIHSFHPIGTTKKSLFRIGKSGHLVLNIYVDSNYDLYIEHVSESGNPISNQINGNGNPINVHVPHFIVCTISNNSMKTYIDSVFIRQNPISSIIREALYDDEIYFGDSSMGTSEKGILLRRPTIYDHALSPSIITRLYQDLLDLDNIHSFGNTTNVSLPLYRYRDTTMNPTTIDVSYQIHGYNTIFTQAIPKEDNSGNNTELVLSFTDINITNVTQDFTFTCWFHTQNSKIQIKNSTNNTIFDIGHRYYTTQTQTHIGLVFEHVASSSSYHVQLYYNGYLYDPSYNTGITLTTDCSMITFDIANGIIHSKALDEFEMRSVFFNAYTLNVDYDISGYHDITLSRPTNNDFSGNFALTLVLPSYIDICNSYHFDLTTDISDTIRIEQLDPLVLNTFHRSQHDISLVVMPHNIETIISGKNKPYIDISDSYFLHHLYTVEDVSFHFKLEDPGSLLHSNISYTYHVSGDFVLDDISLGGTYSDISGTIQPGHAKTIYIKEDFKVEGLDGFEQCMIEIPDLHLATAVNIYDKIYFAFTDKQRYANFADPITYQFGVRLYSLDSSHNNVPYTYDICGIDTNDVFGDDLSGSFTMSTLFTVDGSATNFFVSNELNYTMNVNPYTVSGKYNLPFTIFLTHSNDLSFVQNTIILNDFYNIQTSAETVYEGDIFTISLYTPIHIPNGTIFQYTISGDVNLHDLSGETNLSGLFTIQDHKATKDFHIAYDLSFESTEQFIVSVDYTMDSIQYTISTEVMIDNRSPIFTLRSNDLSYNEGDPIYMTLDASYIPQRCDIKYELRQYDKNGNDVIKRDDFLFTDNDGNIYADISGVFAITNGSTQTITLKTKEDILADGGKNYTIILTDYPDISHVFFVKDTSQHILYDLSANKTSIDEGETLTIFLYTGENDKQKNIDVDYEITGIQQTDLLSGSITGTFHVVNHVGQLDFIIRRDNFTEGNETMTLKLVRLEDEEGESLEDGIYFIEISINDTSKGVKYEFITSVNNVQSSNFYWGNTIDFSLNTTNVAKGSRVAFTMNTNGNGEIFTDSNPFIYNNHIYQGMFVVDYLNKLTADLSNNITDTVTVTVAFNNLTFDHNSSNTDITSTTITITIREPT